MIALISGAFGAAYDLVEEGSNATMDGIIYGMCIGVLATMHERGILLRRLRNTLRRLPTIPYLLASQIVLLLLVLAGAVFAGSICWAAGFGGQTWLDRILPSAEAIVYALLVSAATAFVLRIRDLIGAETFKNLMLGRYHRPVSEDRVFLFLDLQGSTAYAEMNGDLAAQKFLGAVFAAIASPIRKYGGQVDDYVGDLAIVSWPLDFGVKDGACIQCVFEIMETLDSDRTRWRKRFSQVPRLRVALHGGSVITAEIGVDRHKIAYFGDVMNATARLEALGKELAEPVVISEDLLNRMESVPSGVQTKVLGTYSVHGRSATMTVHSLERTFTAKSPATKKALDA